MVCSLAIITGAIISPVPVNRSVHDEFAQGEKCTRLTPILAQFSALVASHRGESNIYLHNPDRINVVIFQRRKWPFKFVDHVLAKGTK